MATHFHMLLLLPLSASINRIVEEAHLRHLHCCLLFPRRRGYCLTLFTSSHDVDYHDYYLYGLHRLSHSPVLEI